MVDNKPVLAKKWTVLIIFHIFGCAHIKMFELGPLLFPYQYQESNSPQNVAYVLAAYMLIQYVLVHFLLWKTGRLRHYHLSLLKVNLYLSGCTILIFPWLARGEIYSSISLTKYMLVYEGVSMGMLLISTGAAFAMVRASRKHR